MKTDTKSKIEHWSKTLTERIMDNQFFEKEEIENLLRIYLPMVLKNFLEPHESSLVRQIEQTKLKLANCQGVNQLEIQKELTILNAQRGKEFNLYNSVKKIVSQDLRYKTLHDVVFEKLGKQEMKQIQKEFNKRLNN
ncbi:MAG: hypothetical protein WC055_02180 [Melioribacteraceae bacterium]